MLDPELRNFFHACLHPVPTKRPLPSELLDHAFFQMIEKHEPQRVHNVYSYVCSLPYLLCMQFALSLMYAVCPISYVCSLPHLLCMQFAPSLMYAVCPISYVCSLPYLLCMQFALSLMYAVCPISYVCSLPYLLCMQFALSLMYAVCPISYVCSLPYLLCMQFTLLAVDSPFRLLSRPLQMDLKELTSHLRTGRRVQQCYV